MTWRLDAACIGRDPELWFSAVVEDVAEAKRICAACPVARACAAMASTEKYGTWAGRTEAERGYRHQPEREFRRFCTIDGCQGKHQARGLCHAHYMRRQRNGELALQVSKHTGEPCATIGCSNPRRAREWCATCYRRNRRRELARSA